MWPAVWRGEWRVGPMNSSIVYVKICISFLESQKRGSFGKVYIVRFSYPSFELARWRNSVHSASRVTLVRVYAGHAAGRDLGAAAAMLI